MMATWGRGLAASERERYGPSLLPPSTPILDSLLFKKPPEQHGRSTQIIVLCCSQGRKGQVDSAEPRWEP